MITTAYYDNTPPVLEAVGNGSCLYRWGIEEVAVENDAGSGDEIPAPASTQWRCHEVVVWATVTRAKITEAVIAATWPPDVEAKLVNDYNAATLGVFGDANGERATAYIARYREFLAARADLKDRIADDCQTLNIM